MSEAIDAGRALGELLGQATRRRTAMPSEAEVNAATTRLQGWIDANVRHAASEHMADVATLLAAVERGNERTVRLVRALYHVRLFAEEGEAMPEDIDGIIEECRLVEDLLPPRGQLDTDGGEAHG